MLFTVNKELYGRLKLFSIVTRVVHHLGSVDLMSELLVFLELMKVTAVKLDLEPVLLLVYPNL